MKKIAIATTLILCSASSLYAQKYMTRNGNVTFNSSTPVENIEAINNETAAILDSKTGEIVYQVPIKSFKFQKALMQEHFNENYMESDKYPKAEYKGKLVDASGVNFTKDGSYNVNTAGKLTIHGVTKDIKVPGSVTVKGNTATIASKFKVVPKDYNINIPSLVAGKIAKEIEVSINTALDKK